MHWIILIIAGFFETFWAVFLKMSEGFTKLVPSIVTVAGMIVSFLLLSAALKQLPLGTAYAVWTGIGMVGTFIAGVILFKEQANPVQIICVLLILVGIIGLRLTEGK